MISPEITPILAGYLAVHHHQNNLAMLFVNPDKKVRLLLSYVLYGLRHEMARFTTAVQHRAMISFCHTQVKEIKERYNRNELDNEQAIRLLDLYTKKGEMALKKLLELSNATD